MSDQPSLSGWRQAGKTFSYRQHPIFFRDEGNGPPLLCIHGFPTASWDWHRVWPFLETRFRLLAPDMIGFGFSAKPRDYDYSLLDQADLHEALLARLNVDRVFILAHDYGDTVVQELLARQLEGMGAFEIGAVCLLNGGLFPKSIRPRPVQRLLLSPLGPMVSRLINERLFSRSFAAIFGPATQPSDEEMHDFWSLVNHDGGAALAHKIIHYLRERRHYRDRWVGALQETGVPLRFIVGPLDPVSGRHMAERYRELIPDPDVVILEGIGHYPQLEDAAGTVRELLSFFERA